MPISHRVLGQLVYPFGEHGYLDLGRAGVLFTEPGFACVCVLFPLVQFSPLYPFK